MSSFTPKNALSLLENHHPLSIKGPICQLLVKLCTNLSVTLSQLKPQTTTVPHISPHKNNHRAYMVANPNAISNAKGRIQMLFISVRKVVPFKDLGAGQISLA